MYCRIIKIQCRKDFLFTDFPIFGMFISLFVCIVYANGDLLSV